VNEPVVHTAEEVIVKHTKSTRLIALAVILAALAVMIVMVSFALEVNGRNNESKRTGERVLSLDHSLEIVQQQLADARKQIAAAQTESQSHANCVARITTLVNRTFGEQQAAMADLVVGLAQTPVSDPRRADILAGKITAIAAARARYEQVIQVEASYDKPNTPAEPCPA
jgi:ABC-type thiamine transport system substrate-binding protein